MRTLNLKLGGKKLFSNLRPDIFQRPTFEARPKLSWVQSMGAKYEATPTLRPDQANGTRPGFTVCPQT